MSFIKKEDGSISIIRLIGLAILVSIVMSIVGTILGSLAEEKISSEKEPKEENEKNVDKQC